MDSLPFAYSCATWPCAYTLLLAACNFCSGPSLALSTLFSPVTHASVVTCNFDSASRPSVANAARHSLLTATCSTTLALSRPSVVNVANIAIARGGYYFSTDIMKIPQASACESGGSSEVLTWKGRDPSREAWPGGAGRTLP
jgi:hypothetical protein